jgi:hypothetical protein
MSDASDPGPVEAACRNAFSPLDAALCRSAIALEYESDGHDGIEMRDPSCRAQAKPSQRTFASCGYVRRCVEVVAPPQTAC